jgi:plasmid maintenance system antidote protein VapI
MRLSRHLCTTEEFWLRLQAAHDLTKAKAAFGKQVNAQVKPRRTSTRDGGPAPEQA